MTDTGFEPLPDFAADGANPNRLVIAGDPTLTLPTTLSGHRAQRKKGNTARVGACPESQAWPLHAVPAAPEPVSLTLTF
jgi:hypothetical protein